MKIIIISMLGITLSPSSWALRCGSQIVTEGDSINHVVQLCGTPKSGYSDIWGDKKELTYDNGAGGQETVKVLNGKVTTIDFNRK